MLLTLAAALIILLLPRGASAGGASPEAIAQARAALDRYAAAHPGEEMLVLAVIDYSKPSWSKRMQVIDLVTGKSKSFMVAHGKKSGGMHASTFSNEPESNMSSLGLFKVAEAYMGDHGLAMRLDGLDSLQNSNARKRDIVLHAADYVSTGFIIRNLLTFNGPRIGRSSGCIVVSRNKIVPVVRLLERGAFIYVWAGKTP